MLIAVASLGLGGCDQILWTAAVGPGLVAARLSERRSAVTFRVVDASNDRPIENATVGLSYPGGWYAPEDRLNGTTDAKGEAKLDVVRGDYFDLAIRATGYRFDQKTVPDTTFTDPPPTLLILRLDRDAPPSAAAATTQAS